MNIEYRRQKQLFDDMVEIMKDLTEEENGGITENELRTKLDEMVDFLKETGWLIED